MKITTLPLSFLAGSAGPLELLVIFVFVLILFGPRRLPEIARSLGRMLHALRKASEDFKSQVMAIDSAVARPVAELTQELAGDEPTGAHAATGESLADASVVSAEAPPDDEDARQEGTRDDGAYG